MIVERVIKVHNPRPKSRRRKARRKNPNPLVMSLGVINPHKGSASMAKTKKKGKKNPSHRRHHRHARRRNPVISAGGGVHMAKSVVGGLIGVTLTKMVSNLIAGMVPGAASGILRAVISAASAFGIGKIVSSVDRDFGAAAAFGGYMQAGSDALTAIAPSLGSQIGLRGLGVWMPSMHAVPENTIMRGAMAAAPPAPQTGMGYARRGF